MHKKIILITLMVFLVGCGMTSKDTATEAQPLNTTQIYALTDKGISISDSNGAKWTKSIQKSRTNNLASSLINDVLLGNDTLYLATDKGLNAATGNFLVFSTFLPDIKINSLVLNGLDLYVASDAGCFISTNNANVFSPISPEGAYTKIIINGNNLYAAKHKELLVCTNNVYEWKKVFVCPEAIIDIDTLKGDRIILTSKGLYVNEIMLPNLQAENLRCMFTDKTKGVLWVATDKGLNRSSDNGKSWSVYDKNSGLDTLDIDSILVDNLNIYLGTPYGLIHSINAGETWKTYKKQHGLVSGKILKVIIKK